MHWCVDCRSALAEAEVEYYDKTSPSIDVAFRAVDQDALKAKFAVSNVNGPFLWLSGPPRRGRCLPTAQSPLHLILIMRWCKSTVRPHFLAKDLLKA